jgi:hypothetical protein
MAQYTFEQHVLLYDTYMKYGSARRVSENLDVNFVMKEFPADNSQFGE